MPPRFKPPTEISAVAASVTKALEGYTTKEKATILATVLFLDDDPTLTQQLGETMAAMMDITVRDKQ